MVIQNFAHTEYDLNAQELKVFSRHSFDKKGLKIVGAVSVIFVQPAGQNENVDEFQQTMDEVSSSLSVITLPDFTGKSNQPGNSTGGYRADVTLPNNHVNTRSDEFVNNHNVSIIDFSKPIETNRRPQHATPSRISNDDSQSISVHDQVQNFQGHDSNQSHIQRQNIPENISNQIANVSGHASNQTVKISTPYGMPTNISNVNSFSSYSTKILQKTNMTREISKAIARINNKQTYHHSIVKKPDSQKIVEHTQDRKVPVKFRPKPMRIKALVVTKEKKNDVKCGICQLKLESCTEIMSHSKLHNLDLACCVCEAKFASYCNMRRHCAGHVQTILYLCSLCHCAYKRKDNLQTHIKKHYRQAGVSSNLRQQFRHPYVRTTPQSAGITKHSENQNNNNSGEKSNSLPIIQSNIDLCDPSMTRAVVNSAPEYQNFRGGNHLSNSVDNNHFSNTIDNNHMSNSVENQIDLTLDDEQASDSTENVENASCPIIELTNNNKESNEATSSTGIEGEMTQIQELEGVISPVEDKTLENSSASPNQILNYSCSSCNIQFDQVESLKRHILSNHSEQMHDQSNCNPGSDDNSNVTNSDFIKIEVFEEANYSGNQGTDMTENNQQVVDIGNLSDYSNRYTPVNLNQTGDMNIVGDSNLITFSPNSSLLSAANHLGNMPSNNSAANPNSNMFKGNKGFKKGRYGDRLGSITPICRICGIMFKDIQQVIDHKAEHPIEIPQMYGCTICNTDLSSKECLRRHIRNHLGEEHQCYYCPCKYSRTDNLYAHMKNAHGWIKPTKNSVALPYYSSYSVPK